MHADSNTVHNTIIARLRADIPNNTTRTKLYDISHTEAVISHADALTWELMSSITRTVVASRCSTRVWQKYEPVNSLPAIGAEGHAVPIGDADLPSESTPSASHLNVMYHTNCSG